MEQEIKVKTYSDFQQRVDEKDFRISKIIVNEILNNLTTSKTKIHIMSINCSEEDMIYDVSLDKEDFAKTLEENLPYFVENEQFEKCSEITKAIEQLKK